jgi:hypothetical protein
MLVSYRVSFSACLRVTTQKRLRGFHYVYYYRGCVVDVQGSG